MQDRSAVAGRAYTKVQISKKDLTDGYEVAETVSFTVTATGEIQTVEMFDARTTTTTETEMETEKETENFSKRKRPSGGTRAAFPDCCGQILFVQL